MDFAGQFLADNMWLIFFLNGLAFFVVGLSVALEIREPSDVEMAGHYQLLSAYGFAASLGNWLQMGLLIPGQAVPWNDSLAYNVAKLLFFVLSAVFLLRFGSQLVISLYPRYGWLRWGSLGLGVLYVLALAMVLAGSDALGGGWLSPAEIYARYILHLPALLLSVLALWGQYHRFKSLQLSQIAGDSLGASLAFGLKTAVSGIIAFPILGLPESLQSTMVVPIQFLRTLSTVAIAFFVVRLLRFFEIERRRQLRMAQEQQFQAQAEALKAERRAREEIERWSKRLEDVVSTIAAAVSESLGLEEMLHAALSRVLDLTRFEAGEIFLAQERPQELQLIAQSGFPEAWAHCRGSIKLGVGVSGELYTSGETIVVRNVCEDSRLRGMPCQEAGFRVLVSIPVRCRGNPLGIMNLLSEGDQAPSVDELGVLAAVGQQLGVAIENARLTEQLQRAAASEERDWIGRELHDGLAQVLGYLRLKCNDLERLLSSGEASRAATEVGEMREVVRQAYADVRESILGLRTTITPGAGLVPTLTEYLHKFGQQSGISAQLVTADDAEIVFAPRAEIQLLRIIQEALTNIRKHSQASKAWVRFAPSEDGTAITVEDNGRGFDPSLVDQNGRERFGLQTMRERAESVGGTLQISTQPGQGTRVVVRLPVDGRGGN